MSHEVTIEQVIQKERQIEILRHELNIRSQRADAALTAVLPNFPPRFLCIRPLVRHDIVGDISPERQRFAKICFGSYIALCVIIFLNIIAAVIGFASPQKDNADSKSTWGTHFGVSFLYLLGIPGAFMLWYFPLYTGLAKGKSGKYTLASFGVFLAFCFSAFMAVGIFGFGGCGFLFVVAAQTDKRNSATTIVGIIVAIAWAAHAVLFLYIWPKMRKLAAIDQVRALGMDVVPAAGRTAVPAPGQHEI
jgi:secretory carrier-associated membrane protein